MKFYPHNIDITFIPNAVSASSATTASLIANFNALPVNKVNTASVALNFVGASGTNGTSILVTGPKGPTGDRGPQGLRGDSVFLLSGSWNVGSCVTPSICYEIQLYEPIGNLGQYYCGGGSGNTVVVYTTDAAGPVSNTSTIYADSGCTTLLPNSVLGVVKPNNATLGWYAGPNYVSPSATAVWTTNGSAIVSYTQDCIAGFPPGGGDPGGGGFGDGGGNAF
jgi:hypothetical protein